MKKILSLILLVVALGFAAETAKAPSAVTINPSKEQLAKAKPLNNTICPVSKEKIGDMGKAVPVIYKGQIINLCCNGCPADFAKDPEKYMKLVQEELAKSKAATAPTTMPEKMSGMDNMPGMDHSKK